MLADSCTTRDPLSVGGEHQIRLLTEVARQTQAAPEYERWILQASPGGGQHPDGFSDVKAAWLLSSVSLVESCDLRQVSELLKKLNLPLKKWFLSKIQGKSLGEIRMNSKLWYGIAGRVQLGTDLVTRR